MSKTLKVVGAIVAVGAIVWAGTAWYTGSQVEQELRQYVEQLNAEQEYGTTTLTRYDRGLFSSEIHSSWSVGQSALAEFLEPEQSFSFVTRVQHGPFPWMSLSRGQFAPVLAAASTTLVNDASTATWFAAVEDGEEPLQEQSRFGYDGWVDSQLTLAPILHESAQGRLQTGEVRLDSRFTRDLASVQFNGAIDDMLLVGLLASDENDAGATSLRMQDTSFEADYRMGRFDTYVGAGGLRIGRLVMDDAQADPPMSVALEDYRIDMQLNEDERNLNASIFYGIGATRVMNTDLGRMDTTIRIGNIDGETVRGLAARYREVAPQIMAESREWDSDEMPPQMSAFLRDSLVALLSGQPTIAIDPLRWALPEGESSLRLNASFQQAPAGSDELSLQTLYSLDGSLVLARGMLVQLFQRFDQLDPDEPVNEEVGRASAELAYDFVRQMALANGFMVEEGDNLVTRVSYANGMIRLNGEAFPLGALLSGMGVF